MIFRTVEVLGVPIASLTMREAVAQVEEYIDRRAGVLVDMSPREFSVLRVLLEARGHVLSRQQIEERLYSWDAAIESNAVEVHIHHLRRKLGSGSILTMRGVGYFIPQEAA